MPPASTTPGLPKHGHELRRPCERRFAFLEQPAHELGDVRRVRRRALGRRGRIPGDGEDGALARVVEGCVEPVRAGPQRGRDVGRAGAGPVTERLAEAEEEVGQHHSGVPAGAEHRGARHRAAGVRKRRVAERPEGVGDGAQSEAEVGAGVAVGDRKDVDPVDLVAAGRHPVGGREDGAGEPGTVDVGDPDAHAGRVTPGRRIRAPPRGPRGGDGR